MVMRGLWFITNATQHKRAQFKSLQVKFTYKHQVNLTANLTHQHFHLKSPGYAAHTPHKYGDHVMHSANDVMKECGRRGITLTGHQSLPYPIVAGSTYLLSSGNYLLLMVRSLIICTH